MKIKGKILKVLPVVTGNGKYGNWMRREIVIAQDNKYNSQLCLCIWDKKLVFNNFSVGDDMECEAELESKFNNNKWFTQAVVKNYTVVGRLASPEQGVNVEDDSVVNEEDDQDYEEYDNNDSSDYSRAEYREMYEAAFENDPQWEWNID